MLKVYMPDLSSKIMNSRYKYNAQLTQFTTDYYKNAVSPFPTWFMVYETNKTHVNLLASQD